MIGWKNVTLEVEEPYKEIGPWKHDKRFGTMDKNELHLNPSDAMDRNKQNEWLDAIGATIAMIVMLRSEYELYVSGSPTLTRNVQ